MALQRVPIDSKTMSCDRWCGAIIHQTFIYNHWKSNPRLNNLHEKHN